MEDNMKKLSILISALMIITLCITGCGNKEDIRVTDTATGSSGYENYDGYAYYLDNGDVKYRLDTKNGFKMHCFFQYDSPEYVEEVYAIDLQKTEDYVSTAIKITDGSGMDITDNFKSMTFTEADGELRMEVERDESTLAGGESSSIMSGIYSFMPPKDGTSSGSSGSSKYGETMYTTDELGRLAQSYYKRHNGYCPPEVAVTDNGNYTFTIQLYETKDNGDGTYHTATSAWYTVDQLGRGTNDLTGESISLEN